MGSEAVGSVGPVGAGETAPDTEPERVFTGATGLARGAGEGGIGWEVIGWASHAVTPIRRTPSAITANSLFENRFFIELPIVNQKDLNDNDRATLDS